MNSKKVFLFVLLTLLVLVSGNCVAKRNTGVAMNEGVIERYQWNVDESDDADGRTEDARITSAIKMKFANDVLLSSSKINVDTINGSVTLNGEVSSQIKADHATQLGRSVDGVKRVRSNLIVQNSTKY